MDLLGVVTQPTVLLEWLSITAYVLGGALLLAIPLYAIASWRRARASSAQTHVSSRPARGPRGEVGQDKKVERRDAPRIAQPFIAYYQGPNRKVWDASPLTSLSWSGASFARADKFEVGESLRLRLALPALHEPAQITAEVVWKRALFSGTMRVAECGVVFRWLSPEAQRAINEVVRQYIVEVVCPSCQRTLTFVKTPSPSGQPVRASLVEHQP